MIQRPKVNASPLGIRLSRLASLAFFTGSLGFLLHTSQDPVWFGKYDAAYAGFLAWQFLVIVPAFHFLARFCAVEHELKTPSGRTIVVRPWHKLMVVFVAWWVSFQATSMLTERFVGRRIMATISDMYHPYLQNTPVPNDAAQHVNRWGFRGDDLEQAKADDVFRIFVFGGSTVYCGTVPFEQTHCRVMEQRLREAYPQFRIEVQNLGADWHTTEHDIIKLLFFAQDFSPDLVISFHGINDLARSLSPDMLAEGPYWSDYRHYLGATASLATHGRKLPWFVAGVAGHWCSDLRFDQIRIHGPEGQGLNGMRTYFVPKAYPVDVTRWRSLPAFERNMRDFVAIARAKGIHVLLGTQPSLYRDDLTKEEQQLLLFPLSHHFRGERPSLRSMIEGLRLFNDSTRRTAAELAVDLVDLERRMPKQTEYLYDDVHFTKAGNELIGNAFADEILAKKIVDRVMAQRQNGSQTQPGAAEPGAEGR